MVDAFLAVAFSVLGGIQVVLRSQEYAIAKPSRDIMFTVDQQANIKPRT